MHVLDHVVQGAPGHRLFLVHFAHLLIVRCNIHRTGVRVMCVCYHPIPVGLGSRTTGCCRRSGRGRGVDPLVF